jgi:hypothetical protein
MTSLDFLKAFKGKSSPVSTVQRKLKLTDDEAMAHVKRLEEDGLGVSFATLERSTGLFVFNFHPLRPSAGKKQAMRENSAAMNKNLKRIRNHGSR